MIPRADMLSEQYNGNGQVETHTHRTLNLRVSCTNELTHKLNRAVQFVLNKIGFRSLDDFHFSNELKHITRIDINGNRVNVELQIIVAGMHKDYIIFHTDDCLRDYHRYITSGVEFINRPEYTPAGLQVNFIDDADNCYTLLEERNYNES
jgi:hypothetical protein